MYTQDNWCIANIRKYKVTSINAYANLYNAERTVFEGKVFVCYLHPR